LRLILFLPNLPFFSIFSFLKLSSKTFTLEMGGGVKWRRTYKAYILSCTVILIKPDDGSFTDMARKLHCIYLRVRNIFFIFINDNESQRSL
jgi:hypothetical protein